MNFEQKIMSSKEMLLDLMINPYSEYRCIEDKRCGGCAVGSKIRCRDDKNGKKIVNLEWENSCNVSVEIFQSNGEMLKWMKVLNNEEREEVTAEIKRLSELL